MFIHCRNSQLVEDEDDLKGVAIKKKYFSLLKQFHDIVLSKTPRCRKLGHYSEVQNYALMHREGLKS